MSKENILADDNDTDSLVSSVKNSQNQKDNLPKPLPRIAWNSYVTSLRALFKAKKALDRIEKEAGISIEVD